MRVGELAALLAHHDPAVCKRQALPIVDRDDHLVGIITRGDVLRALDADPAGERTVLEAGSSRPVVAYPNELMYDAVNKMLRHHVGRLPVVSRDDQRKLLGYIGRAEVMSARLRRIEEEQVREPGWLRRFF
jgi:CBS domain-containing protein